MKERFALLIDQERCIGCEACTVACRIENKGLRGWIRVETLDIFQKDTPVGHFPELKMCFLPQLCQHCEQPPCVEACPVEAISQREDGVVIMDEELCEGCQTCLQACPYEAIIFNEDKNKAEKCNLCVHRTDQGLDPFCVICCEGQALCFGNLNDLESRISRLIENNETFQLNPEARTGPSVYYRPPKEPRGL